MVYRVIGLVFLSLLCSRVEALDFSETLYPLIQEELNRVKFDLNDRKGLVEDQIVNLQAGLDKIWENILRDGFSESVGIDSKLRPAYVTMQGVIESAITKVIERHSVKDVVISIIAPRIPSPLMLVNGSLLSLVNLNDAQAFAIYRNPILINYLKAGGVLNAIYSYDAKDALSNQELAVETYLSYCRSYPNLIDSPTIKVNMKNFPQEMTGAVYLIDGQVITIESRQLTQIDNLKKQKWAIKFGKAAVERKQVVDDFLKSNR